MNDTVSFRGATGRPHEFTRVDPESAWARIGGVALFAAPDAFGWRIVRMTELTGRPHDVRPLWSLADAERYGATAVFICMELDVPTRRALMADLDAGFTPVCAVDQDIAIAA